MLQFSETLDSVLLVIYFHQIIQTSSNERRTVDGGWTGRYILPLQSGSSYPSLRGSEGVLDVDQRDALLLADDRSDRTGPAGQVLIGKFFRDGDPGLHEGIVSHFHVSVCQVYDQVGDLQVPVYQIVYIEVFVVISERIQQLLSHLDPAHVADELDDGEEGEVDIRSVGREGVVSRELDRDVWESLHVPEENVEDIDDDHDTDTD